MSKSAALARARSLREALLDHGVRKVSIELQTGRPGTPHSRWYDTRFVAEMSHHTVSRPSQGNTPCLSLVKRGRSDVPGPLCNGYMGYDEVYRIICMGWANHPGAGGALTVAGFRIPRNVARPYAWGTEYEGGLQAWSNSMHEAMARANAGILDWLGRPLSAHIEHSTWTSRKIDRLNYTATSGRNRMKPFMGGGSGTSGGDWFDMASKADLAEVVDARVDKLDAQILRLKQLHAQTRNLAVKNPATGEDWPLDDALWSMWHYIYWARVDAAANRAILEAQVSQTSVTSTEVQQFAKDARRAAFVALPAGVGDAVDPEMAAELDA